MRALQLTQGQVALVDDEDFERLSQYKWCYGNNKAYRAVSRKRVYLAREVLMVGAECTVTYESSNYLDNRKDNLYCHGVSTYRVCRECHKKLPACEFSFKRRTCKQCYYADHRERYQIIKTKDPDRYAEERARNRQKCRKYYKANPQHILDYHRNYYKLNPHILVLNSHKHRALIKGQPTLTGAEWEDIKRRFGNKCLCCGRCEGDIVLTMDHVVPLSHGGSLTAENIQPLCKSCNCSKHTKHTDYRENNV